MTTITADVKIEPGAEFSVELRSGSHLWHADEPTDVGGADTGPNPYELLLSSVAARGDVRSSDWTPSTRSACS